jgi:hypothetical protein
MTTQQIIETVNGNADLRRKLERRFMRGSAKPLPQVVTIRVVDGGIEIVPVPSASNDIKVSRPRAPRKPIDGRSRAARVQALVAHAPTIVRPGEALMAVEFFRSLTQTERNQYAKSAGIRNPSEKTWAAFVDAIAAIGALSQ